MIVLKDVHFKAGQAVFNQIRIISLRFGTGGSSGDKSCNISVRNNTLFFAQHSSILGKSRLLRWNVAPFLDDWLLDLPWVGS